MFQDQDIEAIGKINPAKQLSLNPEPGNDGDNWSEIVNLRLEWQSDYVSWRTRGGSKIRLTLPVGVTILNFKGFTARVNASTKRYIALHCDDGNIYLWDVDLGDNVSAYEVIMGGFGTDSKRVEMAIFGKNLYVFDLKTDVYKHYHLERKVSNAFGSFEYSSIKSWRYEDVITMDEEYDNQNIFGFKLGGRAHVAATDYTLSTDLIGTAGGWPGGGYRIYEFQYNGGQYLSFEGVEYKEDALIVAPPGISIQSTDIMGSGTAAELRVAKYPVYTDTQKPALDMFEVDLDSYFSESNVPGADNFGYNITADSIGEMKGGKMNMVGSVDNGIGGYVKQNVIMPITSDLEEISNKDVLFKMNAEGTKIIPNGSFTTYTIYRSYIIFNVLGDGSVVAAGRPELIEVNCKDIFQAFACIRGLSLTIPKINDDNIVDRFLCATRWQSDIDSVFTPSTPKYPNSPYFIIKSIPLDKLEIIDRTDDSKLVRPITEFVEMNGGISIVIPPNRMKFNSVQQSHGTLLIGGYDVARDVPLVYGPDFISNLTYIDFKVLRVYNAIRNAVFTGFSPTSSYGISKFEWDTIADVVTITIIDNVNTTVAEYNSAPPSKSGVVTFVCNAVGSSGITVTLDIDMGVLRSLFNGQPQLFFNSTTGYVIEFSHVSTPNTVGNIRISDSGVPITNQYTGFYFEYFDGRFSNMVDTYHDGGRIPVYDGPGKIMIHSLNTMVSAIHIVGIDESGTETAYYDIGLFTINDPECHGKPIDTPDDITTLDIKEIPQQLDIVEVSNLQDFFTVSTFPQQFSLERQFPIQDQKTIREFGTFGFDQDKTELRTRLAVFTDSNIQIGYLEQSNSVNGGFIAQFETLQSLDSSINEESVNVLNNQQVVYQNVNGIQSLDNDIGYLIDSRRYPELRQNLITDVVYNRENKEYWFLSDTKYLFTVTDRNEVKKVYYEEPIISGGYYHDMFLLSSGNGLMETDLDAETTDTFTTSGIWTIEATAMSRPLTDHLYQLRLLEATIVGTEGNVMLDIDLQRPRYENNQLTWSQSFNSDIHFNSISLLISGRNFEIYRRGIRPRILITVTGGSVIQDVYINTVTTENTGLAR